MAAAATCSCSASLIGDLTSPCSGTFLLKATTDIRTGLGGHSLEHSFTLWLPPFPDLLSLPSITFLRFDPCAASGSFQAVALCSQVLRYFDYVFTGVFTFEMLIKVSSERCRHAPQGAGGTWADSVCVITSAGSPGVAGRLAVLPACRTEAWLRPSCCQLTPVSLSCRWWF